MDQNNPKYMEHPPFIDHFIGKLKIFYIYLSLPDSVSCETHVKLYQALEAALPRRRFWISGTSGDFVCKS